LITGALSGVMVRLETIHEDANNYFHQDCLCSSHTCVQRIGMDIGG
jgi:hypothetical protein